MVSLPSTTPAKNAVASRMDGITPEADRFKSLIDVSLIFLFIESGIRSLVLTMVIEPADEGVGLLGKRVGTHPA
jgi:hypothetical protein